MRILGLIPARGGSKGLHRKNIYPLADKPLISYTIEAAQQANLLDECIVSTDSPDIAKVAEEYGASVPFMRPREFATDTASSADVAIHALEFMQAQQGSVYDALVLLQPTCPLRNSDDIDAAIETFKRTGADAVISLYKLESTHPFYMYTLDDEERPHPLMADATKFHRRQDYPAIYERNGAVYLIRPKTLYETKSFFKAKSIAAIVMPQERSVSIDTLQDVLEAEAVLSLAAEDHQ